MSSQYFASGDLPGVSTPASDPFAIAVGGTTLGISQAGRRMFETGWSSGAWQVSGSGGWQRVGTFGAASGGASQLWRQPAYQKGVVPASLAMFGAGNQGRAARSVPDLSAVADDLTGFTVGMLTSTGGQPPVYTQFPVGGTSLATPLVAAMVAVAQQGQPRPFGFVNPVLYRLAKTTAFYDTLPLTSASPAGYRGAYCPISLCGAPALATFDDQSPDLYTYTGQVTLPGYDNMTGLGSIGPDFVRLLRAAER